MKKRRRLVKFLTILSTVVVIFVALAVPCLAVPADNNQPVWEYSGSFDLISTVTLRNTVTGDLERFTSVLPVSSFTSDVGSSSDHYFADNRVQCYWRLRDYWWSWYDFDFDPSVFGDFYVSPYEYNFVLRQNNFQYSSSWSFTDAYTYVNEYFGIVPRGTFVNLRSEALRDLEGVYAGGYEYDYSVMGSEFYNGVSVSGVTSFTSDTTSVYVNGDPEVKEVALSYTPYDYELGDVFTVAPWNYYDELSGASKITPGASVWTVRLSYAVGLDENGYVGSRSHETIIIEPDAPPDINVSFTSWLGTAVSGFVSFQIFPGFSIGALLTTLISFSCVMWFLKLVAGG